MEVKKSDLNWLMNKIDTSTNRYMNAENELLKIALEPWYKRFLIRKRILNYFKKVK